MMRQESARSTLINHPKLCMVVRNGQEGPEHDPYGYEEYHITTPKGTTIIHMGLGEWITHNKTSIELRGFTDTERVAFIRKDFMLQLTGYTWEQLERIARKRTERCRTCGSKRFECVPGMPGEDFTICADCGEVAETCFHLSAVL